MTSEIHNGDAEYEYVTGQGRPSFAELLKDFEEESSQAAAKNRDGLDIIYGPGERQRFDFFSSQSKTCLTLIYLHAGYWQSRDKSSFRFLANSFNRAGLNVALVNYPLCPFVSVAEIIERVRDSIPAIASFAGETELIVSGHSAGAHLATEIALSGLQMKFPIKRVVALSGIYDLAPLIDTSLNRNLNLTAEQAQTASPIRRVVAGLPPTLFAVGGEETAAFITQNHRMAERWSGVGNFAREVVVSDANHFTILREFADPRSALFKFAVSGPA